MYQLVQHICPRRFRPLLVHSALLPLVILALCRPSPGHPNPPHHSELPSTATATEEAQKVLSALTGMEGLVPLGRVITQMNRSRPVEQFSFEVRLSPDELKSQLDKALGAGFRTQFFNSPGLTTRSLMISPVEDPAQSEKGSALRQLPLRLESQLTRSLFLNLSKTPHSDTQRWVAHLVESADLLAELKQQLQAENSSAKDPLAESLQFLGFPAQSLPHHKTQLNNEIQTLAQWKVGATAPEIEEALQSRAIGINADELNWKMQRGQLPNGKTHLRLLREESNNFTTLRLQIDLSLRWLPEEDITLVSLVEHRNVHLPPTYEQLLLSRSASRE